MEALVLLLKVRTTVRLYASVTAIAPIDAPRIAEMLPLMVFEVAL